MLSFCILSFVLFHFLSFVIFRFLSFVLFPFLSFVLLPFLSFVLVLYFPSFLFPLLYPPQTHPLRRLFWIDGKVDKARNWFNRSVKIDPDNGDTWAYFVKFENQHGTNEERDDVIKRCVEASPKHGLLWPSVAKNVANYGKSVKEILALVAVALP